MKWAKSVLLAREGVQALSLTGVGHLAFVILFKGPEMESWKNPLIKIRLGTKQRITEGESQRENELIKNRNRERKQAG